MPLLVKHLYDHMQQTLAGGGLPSGLDKVGILNQAGDHLYSMHPWKFAQGRSALLNLRGRVTGTGAAWTAATKTLTLASGFTSYSFLEGDELEVTDAGSGATLGFYEIASRTSANAVVLTTEISATDQTGIGFTIQPYSIALPENVRDLIAIQGTGNGRYRMTLTSLQEVLDVRENDITTDVHWYAALSYAGSPPVPILEIAPGSGSAVSGAFRLFYRSRWARLGSSDAGAVDIPAFAEGLLVQLVRAFARGYVREDQASLDARLAEIHAGPVFEAARRSDGALQPFKSQTRGGISRWRMPGEVTSWRETVDRIGGPS